MFQTFCVICLRALPWQGVEGKELQRHWLNFQTELVQLLNDNNKMADTVSRLKSEYNVLSQKCLRVDRQYEQQMKVGLACLQQTTTIAPTGPHLLFCV
jgi:hypothetical protein